MNLSNRHEGAVTEFSYGLTHTTKDGDEYDLLTMAAGIMFTESLFLKGIGLSLAIADTNGYGQRVKWAVGDKIKLVIKKPNQTDETTEEGARDIELEFFVVGLTTAAMHASGRSTAYAVYAATASAFYNRTEMLNNTYSKTASEAIAEIAEQYLKMPLIKRDETFGAVSVTGNHDNPFEVIDLLCEQSLSTDDTQLDNIHVMFNSIEGLKFQHLRTVVKEGKTHEYTFVPGQFRSDTSMDYYRIVSWKQQTRPTIEKLIKSGVIRGSSISYDFKSRSISYNEFDYITQHKDIMLMGTEPPIDIEEAKKLVEGTVPQTFAGAKHATIVPSLQAYDRPELASRKYAASKAQKEMLSSSMYTIAIHGNPDLRAGDTINIKAPIMYQDDEGAGLDKWFTGKFLVGSVKHSIKEGEEYTSIVDLYKDAYETPIYD